MAHPDIFPVQPGKDGWRSPYHTPVSRLLVHCGLRPSATSYLPGKTPSIKSWSVVNEVPAWKVSEETRPLPVTQYRVFRLIRKVTDLCGEGVVQDLMMVHARAKAAVDIKPKDYRNIYLALMAALESVPMRKTK